ncbi:helix-turn-helix domain-containing protein [Micromonospora aurantiaca (nom. illeg.)]|uniref:helix-turn-helix domain-containing protein n=1 Tax=Micromonospora aurantiaca (nom. illeg.) TaxID=47850 RepID=UPI000827D42D|nr:helix-turn-helix transcriptional regulator [Micromonospora aurantiaca]SCL28439.1 Helix-turn-helix domain-containing protein [Micromonospora aurantiaca]
MNHDAASILRGLAANRRLTPRAISRASGRAESTIRQLLSGAVPPGADVLHDIAPALQMPVADLLVIAGLPVVDVSAKEGAYAASQEIGRLVAVASRLSSEQVRELITRAEGQVE